MRISRQRLLLSATAFLAIGAVRASAAPATTDVAVGSSVAQTVYLSLRNPAAAEAYARQVQTPGASFHQFLTRDQFVKQFAPTDKDIAKVEAALTQLGYTIGYVFPNHLAIQVTSSAGDAEAALGVKLQRMTVAGRTGMVPVGNITVPASIRDLVRGVGGLNTLRLPHPMKAVAAFDHASTTTPFAAGTALTGGTPGSYLPQDFATRYGVNPIYANGYTGRGTTIGIVTLANFYPADAYNFWQATGLSVSPTRITTVNVDGGADIAPSDALGEGETDIDVEESGGLAPGADLRVYVSPNNTNANFIDGFEATASDNIADTVSTSWGQPELDFFAEPSQGIADSTFLMDAFHDVFLEMGIQGQSMYVAAGDSGSFDTVRGCPNSGTPTATTPVCNAPYAVDSPSNDPAVTAAGGTTTPITLNLRSGAVLSVTQEQAWSWNYIYTQTAAQGHPIALSSLFSVGDGGGVSSYFKLPYYQQGISGITKTKAGQSFTQDTGSGPVTLVTLPSKFAGRNMPDISTDADPESGYQFIEEGSVVTFEGGTSFVAPQLNGVTALAVQGLGGRVGLLNNVLYGLGLNGSDDIVAGDNWGYNAVAAYDNASGVGKLNATKLANSLLQLKALYGR
jgi:kumamolisin